MIHKTLQAVILFALILISCSEKKGSDNGNSLKLWYNQPAGVWEEALPVGNGRLGAMVFGNPLTERIQINEESIWAGSRINNNNQASQANLKKLQNAIFESRYKEAAEIAEKCLLGTPPRIRSYQPLGDLLINYSWDGKPESYRRELDDNRYCFIIF